ILVDLLEIGVDDTAIGRLLRPARPVGSAFAPSRASRLLGLVHGFAQLQRGLGQRLGLRADRVGVVAVQYALQRREGILDGLFVGRRDLVTVLLERLLGRMDIPIGVVARLDHGTAFLVLGGVRLGFLHHAVDVALRQAAGSLDADLLLLAGRL